MQTIFKTGKIDVFSLLGYHRTIEVFGNQIFLAGQLINRLTN